MVTNDKKSMSNIALKKKEPNLACYTAVENTCCLFFDAVHANCTLVVISMSRNETTTCSSQQMHDK